MVGKRSRSTDVRNLVLDTCCGHDCSIFGIDFGTFGVLTHFLGQIWE